MEYCQEDEYHSALPKSMGQPALTAQRILCFQCLLSISRVFCAKKSSNDCGSVGEGGLNLTQGPPIKKSMTHIAIWATAKAINTTKNQNGNVMALPQTTRTLTP
jgi:hypothetical protein